MKPNYIEDNIVESQELGFSLIEVLVSLVVLSFLFVGIFGFISQTWTIKRMTVSLSEKTELAALESFFQDRLSNARSLPIFSEGFLQQKYFAGDDKRFTMVSNIRRGAIGEGLFDVNIAWNSDSKTIFESRAFRRIDKPVNDVPKSYSIFENVDKLKISYAHYNRNRELVWEENWSAIKALPAIINIEGSYHGVNNAHQFSFYLPLR